MPAPRMTRAAWTLAALLLLAASVFVVVAALRPPPGVPDARALVHESEAADAPPPPAFAPGLAPRGPQRLRVRLGRIDDPPGVVVPLAPRAPEPLAPRGGVAATGVVVDDAGQPAVGAFVEVVRGASSAEEILGRATADARGAFRVEGLPEGRVRARLASPWVLAEGDGVEFAAPGDVRLVARRLGRARLRLVPSGAVGVPSTVEVLFGDPEHGVTAERTVEVSQGEVVVEGLPDRRQQIVVSAHGAAPLVFWAHVRPGDEVGLGARVLHPGFALDGRVLDPQGRPLRMANVLGAGHRAEAWTDADGRFRLEHLPEGSVDVVAWAEGHVETLVLVEVGPATASLDLRLPAAARLRGRTAAHASLCLLDLDAAPGDPDGVLRFHADADGALDLELPPGRYRLCEEDERGRVLGEWTLAGGETAWAGAAVDSDR